MASVTLDFRAGQIAEPLEPDIDDLGRNNVVKAKRRNGAEATATLDTGPLGTAAIGRNPKDLDVNPASDLDLPQHAAHQLALATQPGPRFPTITVNLDANPQLVSAVAALDVGGRLSLQSIPPELGRPDADTLALGYQETIGTHSRVFTFNSTRGGILFHVGVLNGGATACLQTSGAQLAAAISDVQTAFLVFTATGPVFTLTPPAGARIIVRDREVMPVVGVASAETDGFSNRTVANGWGNADSGAAYVMDGGSASDYSVSGGFGRILSPTAGVLRYMKLPIVTAYINVTINVRFAIAAASGAGITSRLTWGTDLSNYYEAILLLGTSGSMTLQLSKRLAGVGSTLVSPVTVDTNDANDIWWPRLERGPNGLVRATAYNLNGTGVPTVLTATDTDITDGQIIAVGNRRETGNTDSTLEVRWDTLIVSNPQKFTVTRDPDQRMAHPAGGDVRGYRPIRLTL